MASMVEFLTNGQLGAVQIGLRPDQVTLAIGPADDQSTRRHPLYLMRYGSVEFAFKQIPGSEGSRLVSTAIHFDRTDLQPPQSLRPSDWMPTNETTEDEFLQFVTNAGLPAHTGGAGEQRYLTFRSGASAVFLNEQLHSLHFKRANKDQERRQMTVSLPDETVQILQRRARDEKVSVHDLIDRLIKAGA